MKRFLYQLLTLLSATTFLGCSQNETATPDDDISTSGATVYFLAAANDAVSRGVAVTGTQLSESSSFRVYATKQKRTGNDEATGSVPQVFIAGDVVSYQRVPSTGREQYRWVWKTSTNYYWPQDNYFVDFYAVHPAEAPQISDILSDKSVVYDGSTTDLSIVGQYDLMYASVRTHRDDSEFTSVLDGVGDNSAVALNFHHVLSRIAFYGRLSEELKGYGWTVQVQDISVCNVNVAGTLQFDNNPALGAILTPAASAMPKNIVLPMNDESHLTLTELSVEQDADGINIPLTSPTDIMMLMPQTLSAWDPATENSGTTSPNTSGGYLAVDMRIFDEGGHYHLGSADTYETVFVPIAISWEPSKNYAYTLTFGLGLNAAGVSKKQPITIEAAITPWTSATPVEGQAVH